MREATRDYDVIVVGGGPAGASASVHLSLHGARVLLVEQKRFPRAKLCGEFISPECLTHFQRLGVLDRMMTAGGVALDATTFYAQSGRAISVQSEWLADKHNLVALGLSRAEMDARLLEQARAVGVDVLESTQAVGLLSSDACVHGVELRTDGVTRRFNAPVTIDATGRSRALTRRIERRGNGFGTSEERASQSNHVPQRRASLIAFKAHLKEAHADEGSCEIYFYKGGYGGLNAVESGFSNLCFIASAEDVRRVGNCAETVMRKVLMTNCRAAQTLERARIATPWLCVALEGFGRRDAAPTLGLLAVGDAASFIDPFTGSGMLMALESGELVAGVIARHLLSLRTSRETALGDLTSDYLAAYKAKFDARLRVCALLRRVAFAPEWTVEATIRALAASSTVRRCLSQATRRASLARVHEKAAR